MKTAEIKIARFRQIQGEALKSRLKQQWKYYSQLPEPERSKVIENFKEEILRLDRELTDRGFPVASKQD